MNDKNDSLLEIATSLMKKKRKPQVLDSILEEVFQKKGISTDDAAVVAQFEVDFMLSGVFIYCGEDKNGNQLWDLKERQPSSLLDKDGEYIDSFGFFPDDQIDCPYDIKMFAYQGWMVYNSELNRFASVSFSGSILEIYQLQNNPSLIRKYHDLYPMYRNKSIAKTKGIQYTE